MEGSRLLWPTSESRFLQHPNYRILQFPLTVTNCDDVLLPGSDDELDQAALRAKRRRIVGLGSSYLAGEALYIPSATLYGPYKEPRGSETQFDHGYLTVEDPLAEALRITEARKARCGVREESRFKIRRRPQRVQPTHDDEPPAASPTVVVQELRQARSLTQRKSSPVRIESDRGDQEPHAPSECLAMIRENGSHEVAEMVTLKSNTTVPDDDFATAQDRLSAEQMTDDSPEPVPHPETVADVDINAASGTGNPIDTNREDINAVTMDLSDCDIPVREKAGEKDVDIYAGLMQAKSLARMAISSGRLPLSAHPPFSMESPAGFTAINKAAEDSVMTLESNGTPNVESRVPPDVPRDGTTREAVHSAAKTLFTKLKKSKQKQGPSGLYQAAHDDKASPFLFRKQAFAREGKTENVKINHPQLASSRSSEEPAYAKIVATPTFDAPPAISMSFQQDSLGMNFELMDQFTNRILPRSAQKSGSRASVSREIKRAMRESGASFSGHADDAASLLGDPNSPLRPVTLSKQDMPINSTAEVLEHPTELQTVNGTAHQRTGDRPEISTQTALQEAHLDLCSSAGNNNDELLLSRNATPIREGSPKNTITPFAIFNQTLSPVRDSVREPVVSTQAMFDAFSPFAVSGKKSTLKKKRASFAPSMSPEKSHLATPTQGSLSFDVLDQASEEPTKNATPAKPLQQLSPIQQSKENWSVNSGKSNTGPLISQSKKSSLSSKSTSRQPLQRSLSVLGTEAQRSASHVRSQRLSDVLNTIKDYRHFDKETELKRVLSSESFRSSMRSSSGSAGQKGSVMDWDHASNTSSDHDEPTNDPVALGGPQSSPRDDGGEDLQGATMPSTSAYQSTFPPSTVQSATAGGLLPSFQDAQDESIDVDQTISEFQLSHWDVETAMKQGPE